MSDVQDFLKSSAGSKYPAFKFASVGDTIKGVIAEEPRVIERPNLNDGAMEKNLVIPVTHEDGETYTVWVRKGLLAQAIQDAITTSGADGLVEGGKLAIKFSGTRPSKFPQPAKEFQAQYQPPVASGVGVGDLL